MGPTVWIMCLAFRFPAVVVTASPMGSPRGCWLLRILMSSWRTVGPALRCIVAFTPPPPMSVGLAALIMASAVCCVMSPFTSLRVVLLMVVSMGCVGVVLFLWFAVVVVGCNRGLGWMWVYPSSYGLGKPV